ncbi:glycogenin 1 isoform X2 [Rhodnius prolixus]|uniref:glycogenin 1 isoform X2 n=1 Tax=Rhodnius prolixus TaxID=13249 RepID=UPI003D18CD22
MSGNTAWVTLATNDTYCLGALVLANSLKRVNTVHQLAVLITPGVSQSMRQQLAKVFNVVKEVDVLDSGDEANLALIARPELGVTFTKLHCWNLTQFSKCVFLDADVLVVQNCDELFEREELSAAPDVGWPDCFNSGVFVFLPSKDTFKALIDCALGRGSFDGGDQGLLNTFFNDWPTKDIKKHLPFIYNMVSTASYSYLPAFKLFGSQVKIVHFIGSNKPWLQSGSAATSSLSGFLETWWNIFNSHVAQALSTDMISNCTFDDVRWHNHSSSMHSPTPVHQLFHDPVRGVHLGQEAPQQEERHQFIDPWEEITVDQMQSTTREHCAQSISEGRYSNYSPQRREDCVVGNSEVSLDTIQRFGEIRLTGEDQSSIGHCTNGQCRNEPVSCTVVSLPSTCLQNISELETGLQSISVQESGLQNMSEQETVNVYCQTQSQEAQINIPNLNNFPKDSPFQFHHQAAQNIPSTSTYSSMCPLSSIQPASLPIDMPSNCPQSCSLQQQQSTSRTGLSQEVGLAGALAGGERSAIEDVWRRQNWEQGVIDYMGRDSFENIWKKISESVENKASVPGTAPSAPLTEAGEKSVTPPAVPAESKEVPSQQIAKEPTGSAVAPPVKAEQTEGAPVCAEPPTVDKTTSPTEKKEEAPKTEIEPAKECITSDTAESAKVTPPTSVESAKETAQDLLKTDAPATMAAPGLPSEITPPLVGEPPKTDLPTQLLPAVPELPSEAKTEIHADTKLLQEEKLKAAPSETKEPELKSSADTAGKEVTEAAVAKQEVPKTEASLPTPAEGAKPETTQPGIEVPKDTTSVAPKADIIDAKADEAKMSKPEATSSAAPKTEDVKTLPTEVKPTQEAPKDGSEATEKPSKDDSKQKKTPIDLKEVPGSTETLVKDDSALKAPTLPTSPTQKEASSELKKDDSAQKEPSTPEGSKGPSECSKMPVKDESAPIPLPPIVPTETVAASTETPVPAGTPTTPATPQTHTASGTPVTPTCSPATPTDTKATPTSTPGTPTVTPPTPTGTAPVSTEKSGKDDALPKVPSSPLAVKETTAEQPKKDDCPTKAPSSLTESKDVPKKDDTVPKVPIEPAAISKADVPASVAPSEVSPPAEVPSESTGQAKSSAESKKSPPQPPAAEGASAAAAAPVPPKRKGNKEQKSGNGGKQSKSKK